MLNSYFTGALHSTLEQSAIHNFLTDHLGGFGAFLDEVILQGLLDTLKPMLFLFLTYLLMEFIEHKATGKLERFMSGAGVFGPAVGGLLGAIPQCGFSAAAANLYTGGIVSVGTLVAVFLSTSDEMLPILLSEDIAITSVLLIILYKTLVGILMGFVIDLFLRILKRPTKHGHVEEMCEQAGCNCQSGILRSAIKHTVTVSLFILAVTLTINAVIFFVGEDNFSKIAIDIPVVSHIVCAFVGLIPNCASSVLLTRLATEGIISSGAMMSGLFSGAGIGLVILFRAGKKRILENLIIVSVVLSIGIVFGIIADFIPFLTL